MRKRVIEMNLIDLFCQIYWVRTIRKCQTDVENRFSVLSAKSNSKQINTKCNTKSCFIWDISYSKWNACNVYDFASGSRPTRSTCLAREWKRQRDSETEQEMNKEFVSYRFLTPYKHIGNIQTKRKFQQQFHQRDSKAFVCKCFTFRAPVG